MPARAKNPTGPTLDAALMMKLLFSFFSNRTVFRLFLLALLMFASAASGPSSPAEPASAGTLEEYLKKLGYEAVDFERTDQAQDFVEGILSNGRKHTFLVDTGWGMTALGKNAAKGLKAADQSDPSYSGHTSGPLIITETVLMDQLTLGRVQVLNQPARVEELRVDYIRLPFDAVLGCDFLLRNFCLIDCYKRRLYVPGAKPSDEEAKALQETLRLSGFSEIPIASHYLLTIDATINERSVCLALDTGAPCDELDDSQLKLLDLTLLKYDQASTGSLIRGDMEAKILGVGSIGRHKLYLTRANSLRLGSRNWKNAYFGVTDLKDWGLAKPGTRGESVKGLLGQTTLGMHGALIDIAHQKLWLRPEKPAR
jgi:hypothetical protein